LSRHDDMCFRKWIYFIENIASICDGYTLNAPIQHVALGIICTINHSSFSLSRLYLIPRDSSFTWGGWIARHWHHRHQVCRAYMACTWWRTRRGSDRSYQAEQGRRKEGKKMRK